MQFRCIHPESRVILRFVMARKYSDRERADALALCKASGNLSEVSRSTGIPISTLSLWRAGLRGYNDDLAALQRQSEKTLADKFEMCAHLYIERAVQKEAIKKTSGYYAVKAANEGAVTANLLRGLPTVISETINDSERAAKAAELLNRGRLRLVEKTG